MPPPYHQQRQQSSYNHHNNNNNNNYQSHSQSHSRTSSANTMAAYTTNLTSTTNPPQTSMSTTKTRQYAHLHSQLAQLNAHLADMENLMRMTAAQAGDMRFLGGYVGGLFMGAAKVLGDEGGAKAGAGSWREGEE